MIALLSFISGVAPGRIYAALHDLSDDCHLALSVVLASGLGTLVLLLAVAFS